MRTYETMVVIHSETTEEQLTALHQQLLNAPRQQLLIAEADKLAECQQRLAQLWQDKNIPTTKPWMKHNKIPKEEFITRSMQMLRKYLDSNSINT